MDVKELVKKNADYVVQMRRYFHENPELSMEEFETTKKIAEELDKMGIKYEIPDGKVGVLGVIEGNHPGKTVALRADIDALTVNENTGLEFSSKNAGKMHACGHDGHAAMLLGAAKILNEMKDEIFGKVYLIFQPAEETGKGALYMMEHGDWYEQTDALFGAHVWMGVPSGKVSIEGGERMAATDKFVIKIHGKSGHGSMPQGTVDATVVAAATVMNLQTLVSRKYDPMDAIVVTVGEMHSGTRWNIISGEAVLEGTARYFSNEIGEKLPEDMEQVVRDTAKVFGATVDFSYDRIVYPTTNDQELAEIAEGSVKKVLGEDGVSLFPKTTGGEDFSFYLRDGKRGEFAFVGINNPEKGTVYAHHSEKFLIDEDALPGGAGVYAQFALDFLNKNK